MMITDKIDRRDNFDGSYTYRAPGHSTVTYEVSDLRDGWALISRYVCGSQIGDATLTTIDRAHEDAERCLRREVHPD